ncbi:hypothetical protein FDUTEX481_07588 [Tolypothrix sp. PCC 7601]|nr:hypothetical protein FDUTEX481_07588 [Tolypothrix sp. PCC 7601]
MSPLSPSPQSPLPLIPRGGPEFPSPQSPVPSPQSPIPSLQSPVPSFFNQTHHSGDSRFNIKMC